MIKKIISAVFSVALVVSLLAFYLPGGCPAEQGEQTLNLYGIDPLTLDPAVSGEVTSQGYIRQLFSGLVRLDDKLEPAPDIARRWEVSDDGRTYTFYLRNDVFFHDGRQVRSARQKLKRGLPDSAPR